MTNNLRTCGQLGEQENNKKKKLPEKYQKLKVKCVISLACRQTGTNSDQTEVLFAKFAKKYMTEHSLCLLLVSHADSPAPKLLPLAEPLLLGWLGCRNKQNVLIEPECLDIGKSAYEWP